MLHRVQGIVLRSIDYGEGNKIVTLLTREMGKVGVMARGAKKVKSRLGAVTQLFSFGEFVFFKNGQLGTLNSAELIRPFHKLREDLFMSAYSAYLVELADRLIGEEDASAYLFEQLRAGLEAIEDGKDMAIVAHIFELAMLRAAGYAPEVDACVHCGGMTLPMSFGIQAGGMLCARCRHKDPAAIPVSEATWKLLRLFAKLDLRRLGAITVSSATKGELKACLHAYMDAQVGTRWKSREFIAQMEKYDL